MGGRYGVRLCNHIMPEMAARPSFNSPLPGKKNQQLPGFARGSSLTYQRFSTFKSWYFINGVGFGPSKFIGYQNTSIKSYTGAGNGYQTNKALEAFFVKLDPNTKQYKTLLQNLINLSHSVGKELSKKLYTSGGIYVLKETQDSNTHTEDEDTDEDKAGQSSITTGEGEALTKIRYGQGKFRDCLLKVDERCWMSGITDLSLLVASHIKPWSACENEESARGDVNNGLLLSALWDAAFDGGLITFDENWKAIPSEKLSNAAKKALDFKNNSALPEKFRNDERACYMEYHRNNVFIKG